MGQSFKNKLKVAQQLCGSSGEYGRADLKGLHDLLFNPKEVPDMFCPGCGAKIDDGARFCPVCGQQIQAATAAPAHAAAPAQPQHASQPAPTVQPQPGPAFATVPAMHAAAPASAVRPALSITRIIPCALAIIAIILSFMPWFSVSPTVVQASSYASQGANFLSQLAGQSTDYSSSLGFDDSYSVWGLGKAGEVAVTYQDMYDSASDLASSLSDSYYGDDYSDSGHGRVVGITNPNYGEVSSGGIAFISMAVTAFWALGMLATIAGIVLYLTQGLKVVLPAGCGLMVLSVLAFELLYANMMSAIGSAATTPIFTALFAIAAAALTFVLREQTVPSAH